MLKRKNGFHYNLSLLLINYMKQIFLFDLLGNSHK